MSFDPEKVKRYDVDDKGLYDPSTGDDITGGELVWADDYDRLLELYRALKHGSLRLRS